jgi:polyketide synthase PksN
VGPARERIAIIGMSGCFPGAGDLESFWENLREGRCSITEVPASRWDWRALWGDPSEQANRTNIKWGGFIAGVEEFDAGFFNISPREAQSMDPQQRLLLRYTWEAIEDAGYAPSSLSGSSTGIFVGTASSGYSELLSQAGVGLEGHSSTSAVPSIGPNRMSYLLNVHGPSEPIETACSSSLVALHRAVRAIHSGDCEMALVGGINTIITPWGHISFGKAGMLSEEGRCKTFAKQANGYVRGEGVGMLFLKKLGAAQRAGDHIYGVVIGSAQNHGGRANSLTAPNPKAQAQLLVSAYREAGIEAGSLTYIEAHGTGTGLGDPIEVNGLKSAFGQLWGESDRAYCALGSVKTNIGHLELAAGIAGVIKVLLQMQHGELAPSLHCEELNPYLELEGSAFYVVRERRAWEAVRDGRGVELPRRAGISSFGFGGVNAHVVLEQYCEGQDRGEMTLDEHRPALVVLSGKSEERLREQAQRLSAHLDRHPQVELIDLAYTLQVGREAMEHRLGFTARTLAEVQAKLSGYLAGKLESGELQEC